MTPAELLADAFDRIQQSGSAVLDGLTLDQLTWRPTPDANTIAWLVWHLTRVQDDHLANVMGTEQVWTAEGFARRFDLPLDDAETGYAASAEQVAAVRAEADLLADYLQAVGRVTAAWVAGLTEADLDEVVDESWSPPVTLGARLVSVVNDDTQHVGQAAYVRGLLPEESQEGQGSQGSQEG